VIDPSSRSDSADPGRFQCEVQTDRDAVRVSVVGELDLATVPTLDACLTELRESGFRQLVVDLSRLEFLDSTGLRLLLQYDAQARQDGFSFSLTPGPRSVQRIFELSGTHGLLTFIED
jgi:anti-sigma B factor antagonist